VLPTPQAAQETTNEHSTDLDKKVETLIAKFALSGHQVHLMADGGYVVMRRWCGARMCPDYASLVALGRVVGVL
jgi:hypothetical protein